MMTIFRTMNHILLFILLIPFSFILTGCVTSEKTLDPIYADIQTLRQQISSTQQELALLRQDVKKDTQEELKSLNGKMDDFQSSFADVKANTELNTRDLNIINNRLDEYQERISKFEEKLASSEKDTNQRLEYSVKNLENRISVLEQKMSNSGNTSNIEGMNQSSPIGSGNDAKSLLSKAEQAYQKGSFAEALTLTNNYIDTYPNDNDIPSIKFIQGQALSGLKENSKSLEVFSDFIKNYPEHEKVPAAMLKRALLYKELKENNKQVDELKSLVKKYPLSPEAEQALEELKQ